jgi:hypothetical protein
MSRNYDSSHLIQRKAQRAIAGSFLSVSNNVTLGSRPMRGIKDSSIIYSVKEGQSTQFTRFPLCVGISAGCPCEALNADLAQPPYDIPGAISGITFTVGSIIVSWTAPTTGSGPFTYRVTPYLNGVALPSVTTGDTTYRFVSLEAMQPYTFTVCAMNQGGVGPILTTPSFVAPPSELGTILSGNGLLSMDVAPSLAYVLNLGLDTVLAYAASINQAPTTVSRAMYLWSASVAQAWNWVTADACVTGTHDNWDWASKGAVLAAYDALIWIASVIDYLTPQLIPSYVSPYVFSAVDVARVKTEGQWDSWLGKWNLWMLGRQSDGSSAALTTMPTGSANWNETIVVDGVNQINGFPAPQEYTRLTVQGVKKGYLSYLWDSVTSTCLSEADEADIQDSVGAPATGAARDAEIDAVLAISASLTDSQKAQAEFWAGSSIGTISPPTMFIWLWKEYVRTVQITCPVLIFSLLDLAVHMFEGSRVTWRIKAHYMQDRPIQEIRRRYAGQTVASWNGSIDGAQWVPYQRANFVTPPFPDFTSGHSHFGKVFALTMGKWFGSSIIKNQVVYDNLQWMATLFPQFQSGSYGDFVIPARSSLIDVSPSQPLTVSFSTWDDIADHAGMSRLYGGIHTIAAHTGAQAAAILVDGYINASWNITVPPMLGAAQPIAAFDTAIDTETIDISSLNPIVSV